jgi:hypothetical protein
MALMLLLMAAAFAGAMFWPAIYATAFRQMFRAWPDARESFIGRGSWIAFSRKFGRAYAIGSIVLAFAWIFLGRSIVPNTQVGAWLLFGPALLLIAIGVSLGVLVVCRWIVDEP